MSFLSRAWRLAAALVVLVVLGSPRPLLAAPQTLPTELQGTQPPVQDADNHPLHPLHEIDEALVRLPLAAGLGAALALRPKRRGTPPRSPAVVQTQIVLSLVGAIVMLVVGASLARAFGIVGAANLVRYRSKIDDPKDAAVMLCALSVGLAAGVGLYALTIFSTVFMVAALWVIESFEPESQTTFMLRVKAADDTDGKRDQIERILQSYKLPFELRSASDEEVCYELKVPMEVHTDDVSNRILTSDPEGHWSVEWEEKKAKK
ncbi:MAG: MgtC/SapB family protein [Vicinamibacterales bacterium]